MRGSLSPWKSRSLFPKAARFPMTHWFEEEMENLMERFFGDEAGWPGTNGFTPTTDVVESDGALEVTMDLPGIKAEDVHVELKNGNLWISGTRAEEKEEKEKTYHRIERRHGEFRRVLPLPPGIDEEKVDAHFENGVLKVTVPKSAEARPKHIEVKA